MRTSIKLAAAAAAIVAAAPASAAVVFLDSVVREGEFFRFNYVVEFARNEGVATGSNFSIFDFQGYVDGSITSTNALVSALAEPTSAGLQPVPGFDDDAAITNLRFTYNGGAADLSNQTFAGFSALSRYGAVSLDGFSGLSVKTSGLTAGQDVFTQGPVGVPAIPEPAVWATMILGLGAIGANQRYRRRTTRVAFG